MALPLVSARCGGVTRRAALGGGLAGLAMLGTAQGQAVRGVAIPFTLNPDGRAVVEVLLNGQGPFRLIIDTGATTTVVAPEVAAAVGLVATHRALVHGMAGVFEAPIGTLVSLDLLGIVGDEPPDAARFTSIETALLGGRVLANVDGLLGMGAWGDRRLTLDFAAGLFRLGDTLSGRARSRLTLAPGSLLYGTLMLATARVGPVRARALIDTGATHTLMNAAMARAIPVLTGALTGRDTTAAGAGARATAEPVLIPALEVGDLRVRRLTAFEAPLPVFELWAAPEEPALVLGMDVWRNTLAMSLDYPRAELQLRLDDETGAVRRASGSRVPDDL